MLVEDLLCPPGRATRPARLVIMLRGPPGSGKTFVAKLIKVYSLMYTIITDVLCSPKFSGVEFSEANVVKELV
jgi:SpoVK/Ycf46/Vps4 family AAA+-type ATPase